MLSQRHPSPDFMLRVAQNLYNYRELMDTLAGKNIALRYKQAYLGIAWAIV